MRRMMCLFLLLIPTLVFADYTSLIVTFETIPAKLEPGDSGSLIVTITNSGTLHASNVKLRVMPNPYIIFERYEFSLQTIDAGDSKQVAIPIKVSEETPYGTLTVFYTVSYSEGESSGTKTMSGAASLSVRRRPSLEITGVEFDKDEIEPGAEVTLFLHVKNVGKGEARDVSIDLDTEGLPLVPIGTTSFFIGDLSPGREVMVELRMIVNEDAEIKAYPVPLKFTYYNEDGNVNKEEKMFGIKISGKPEFVVTIDDTENLFTGSVGRVTLSVANRGVATGKYVTVKVESEIPVMPAEVYIGNVEEDDYETVDFDLDLTDVLPGEYELVLYFFYKDPYNKEFNETRIFRINVGEKSKSKGYLIILVFAVIIVLWKRRKLLEVIACSSSKGKR